VAVQEAQLDRLDHMEARLDKANDILVELRSALAEYRRNMTATEGTLRGVCNAGACRTSESG
jgi:hypothetical protein